MRLFMVMHKRIVKRTRTMFSEIISDAVPFFLNGLQESKVFI